MAEIANTLWYRLGTISVTDGSTKVTGVGTHWTTAGINPGATLRVDGKYLAHEVKRVVSDTEIELGAAYYGGSTSGAAYSIDRNFQSTTNAKLAADVTDLVALYERVRDGTMPMIEGKSAYQVAVANGFVGTEADWVESLKGNAEEIAEINTKLDRIYTDNATAHNSVYRGKNLGTALTAEQSAAIRNGTFRDVYLGDYWQSTYPAYSWTDSDGTVHQESANTALEIQWLVFGCNSFKLKPNNSVAVADNHVVVMMRGGLLHNRMNPTNSTEGGYVNSEAFKNTIPRFEGLIKAVFGEDHVMPHWDYLCNAVTNGVETGYAFYENRLCDLPSMEMVFGFPNPSKRDFLGSMIQFPLFALMPELAVAGGTLNWLRDAADTASFWAISNDGGCGRLRAADNPTFAKFAPFFLLH